MKIPLAYQKTEYDCGPTTMMNALSCLFDREIIPPDVVKYIMMYSLDAVSYTHLDVYKRQIHNSFETYWKGLLSHDMQPNAPYREACTIGADFKRLSEKLVNLKKKNRVAMLVSNEALTALNLFRLPDGKTFYNDVVRWLRCV